MALVRWNPTMPWRPSQESWSPFTGMESLRAELDHLFNSFLGSMPSSGTQEPLVSPGRPARARPGIRPGGGSPRYEAGRYPDYR